MATGGGRHRLSYPCQRKRGQFPRTTYSNRILNPPDYSTRDDNDDEIDDDSEVSRQSNPRYNSNRQQIPVEGRTGYGPFNPPEKHLSPRTSDTAQRLLTNISRPPYYQARQTALLSQSSPTPVVTLSKVNVEEALAKIIADYVNRNEYVSVEKVVGKLFTINQVAEWSQLNIDGVMNPFKDLTQLSNLVLKHATVNLFTDVFQHIQIIGTLQELGEVIAQRFEKGSYDELNLGPIWKHPKIAKLFRIPDKQEPRQTTCNEIIDLFYEYTRFLKYTERINFDEFKDHAADKLGVDTWEHLGVFVKGFPYILTPESSY
ncbi:unnamed protein product [Rotaria sp. Silwood2]|nr:unnamed protein product [Rotaria sp. Silwood2]CAF2992864.1 unnamed protein product [Rotaria sp. Silwood2]CAF3365220.1 unnamed protein product [Rotaria sp. Silwood2]CAF4080773.1 unnamed protein product [Rotaria sp. Silwood2]CAF4201198.1 unnamed protein product [Rotaria sp. Silwood2]